MACQSSGAEALHFVVQPSVCFSFVLQLQQLDFSNLFEMGHVQSSVGLTINAFDLDDSKLGFSWWRGLGKFHHVRELEGFFSFQKVCLDRCVFSDKFVCFCHVSFDLGSVERFKVEVHSRPCRVYLVPGYSTVSSRIE